MDDGWNRGMALLAVFALGVLAASLAVLAGDKQQPADLAVDRCALVEYVNDCELSEGGENGTPERLKACEATAKAQATRIKAGIQAQCR